MKIFTYNKTWIFTAVAVMLYYLGAGLSYNLGYDKGVRDAFPTEWTCVRMDHIGSISSLDDKTKLSFFPDDAICARIDKNQERQIGIMYGTGEVIAMGE